MITTADFTLKLTTLAEGCTLASSYTFCAFIAAKVASFALEFIGLIQTSGAFLSPTFWNLASLHAGCAITFWVLTAIVSVAIENQKKENVSLQDEIGPAVLIWGAVTLSLYVLSRLGPADILGSATEAFAERIVFLYLGLSSLPTLALTGVEFLEILTGKYKNTLAYRWIYDA